MGPGRVGRGALVRVDEARTCRAVAPPPASGNVRRMFAHSHQTWWWTAHPAAH
nr:trp operon leader peptide [Streptomyces sp. RPA4-2]